MPRGSRPSRRSLTRGTYGMCRMSSGCGRLLETRRCCWCSRTKPILRYPLAATFLFSEIKAMILPWGARSRSHRSASNERRRPTGRFIQSVKSCKRLSDPSHLKIDRVAGTSKRDIKEYDARGDLQRKKLVPQAPENSCLGEWFAQP